MRRRFVQHILMTTLAAGLCACDAVRALPSSEDRARRLEVAVFEGGYGIHWHQDIAREYAASHADVSVELWGDPRLDQKLKPRLLRGNPPDVMHDRDLPIWLLIANGKLESFNDALTVPAPGSTRAWSDLFIPGTLDTYATDGHVYAIPSAFNAWACWYDARLFREHGWNVPTTWDEFIALCGEIRAAGIAPLAFQGKYPIYGWWTFVCLLQRCGGLDAINRVNALEPGAFSHPDAVWAAQLMQNMAVDHFQHGAMSMTHTESQLQFVNNRAAMIFCGIWLENEMRESTPPGFEMRCFDVPAVPGGKGNPKLIYGHGQEFFLVPSDARYPELALDFVRTMISPAHAPGMGETIGVISPLAGATPREAVTPGLQSVLDMMEESPGIYYVRLERLLHEWRNAVMLPQMAMLMRGETSPEQFGRAMDDGIAQAIERWEGFMPSYTPYAPDQFGEPF